LLKLPVGFWKYLVTETFKICVSYKTVVIKILLVLQIVLNCRRVIISAVLVSMAWIPGYFK